MIVRPKVMWKAPVFLIAAGLISYFAWELWLEKLTLIERWNGEFIVNQTAVNLIHIFFFFGTLVLGHKFLKNMTFHELFVSCSYLFLAGIITLAIKWVLLVNHDYGILYQICDNFNHVFHWSSMVPSIIGGLEGNIHMAVPVNMCCVYFMVMFGHEKIEPDYKPKKTKKQDKDDKPVNI